MVSGSWWLVVRQKLKLTCLFIGISAGYATKKTRRLTHKNLECCVIIENIFFQNLFHIHRVLAHIALIFSAAYRPFCFNHRVPGTWNLDPFSPCHVLMN